MICMLNPEQTVWMVWYHVNTAIAADCSSVQLELFDPSTERSLNYLYEVAKPSSSEIALDAEYLVQIVDPLPKLTKA